MARSDRAAFSISRVRAASSVAWPKLSKETPTARSAGMLSRWRRARRRRWRSRETLAARSKGAQHHFCPLLLYA